MRQDSWCLHLTLVNAKTGRSTITKYPQSIYQQLEMMDRCQIPYGSGEYFHRLWPAGGDPLEKALAGVIEHDQCPPSVRQLNVLANQISRITPECRQDLAKELRRSPPATVVDAIRAISRFLPEDAPPETAALTDRAVLLDEDTPYIRLRIAPEDRDEESDTDGVWVDLPLKPGDVDRAMHDLGVELPVNLEVWEYEGVIACEDLPEYASVPYGPSLREFNRFAEALEACVPACDLKKYKAILRAKGYTTLKDAAELARDMKNYEFYPSEELTAMLQKADPHTELELLADRLHFAETGYGCVRAAKGHILSDELRSIYLRANSKTEETFEAAMAYLLPGEIWAGAQRWEAFAADQVAKGLYAAPLAKIPREIDLDAERELWLGCLFAAFYQVSRTYGTALARKLWLHGPYVAPGQLLPAAERMSNGSEASSCTAISACAGQEKAMDVLMMADVLPTESPYWEDDPAAADQVAAPERIAGNRKRLPYDLSAGVRKLYELGKALQGPEELFADWLQAVYESNADFERPLLEEIDDLCNGFQCVRSRYGEETARELYRSMAVTHPDELRRADLYLYLGGSVQQVKALTEIGYFMDASEISAEQMNRTIRYLKEGGRIDFYLFDAISDDRNMPE